VERQVMGVFSPDLTEPIANVLQRLGAKRAMVVHGKHRDGAAPAAIAGNGMCEITTTGVTRISELRGGAVKTYALDAEADLDLPPSHVDDLSVTEPEQSAALIRGIFDGETGPARDIVCLNAAAGFVVAGLVDELADGLKLAAEAIDSGAAKATLEKIVQLTNA